MTKTRSTHSPLIELRTVVLAVLALIPAGGTGILSAALAMSHVSSTSALVVGVGAGITAFVGALSALHRLVGQ